MRRVERQRSLEAFDAVDDEDGDARVDDERYCVPLPGLLDVRVDAEQAVGGPFEPPPPVYAALENGSHVGAEEAPGETERHDEGEDVEGVVHQNHSALNIATPR